MLISSFLIEAEPSWAKLSQVHGSSNTADVTYELNSAFKYSRSIESLEMLPTVQFEKEQAEGESRNI